VTSLTRWLLAGAGLALLGGCVTAPKPDYSRFFEHHPRSIVIVPPTNRTTAVDAPAVFMTTVTRPFAERGYYVFPVFLTRDILNDLGLSDEGLISQAPPQRFKEVFGADAVLFVTVASWTTTYLVLHSQVAVEANYRLVDTESGEVIWERTERVVEQSRGGNILEMLVSAAITAVIVDYRPLAQRANGFAATKPGYGLPAGPYHEDYQKDYSNFGRPPN
jgi:hypothetical protein